MEARSADREVISHVLRKAGAVAGRERGFKVKDVIALRQTNHQPVAVGNGGARAPALHAEDVVSWNSEIVERGLKPKEPWVWHNRVPVDGSPQGGEPGPVHEDLRASAQLRLVAAKERRRLERRAFDVDQREQQHLVGRYGAIARHRRARGAAGQEK